MTLKKRLRGAFIKVGEMQKRITGEVIANFTTKKDELYLVIRTKESGLINMKLVSESVENILNLGYETVDQLETKIVSFEKTQWENWKGETGDMFVLYQIDKDMIPRPTKEEKS